MSKEQGIGALRVMHYTILAVMSALIVVAVGYVYTTLQAAPAQEPPSPYGESEGKTKPLPDFVLDKVEKDELDLLKP